MWFNEGGKYEYDFGLSDIISALSLNSIEVLIGHENEYWADTENIAFEIFANISAIDILDEPSKEVLSTLLKELYEAYKEIVE